MLRDVCIHVASYIRIALRGVDRDVVKLLPQRVTPSCSTPGVVWVLGLPTKLN
jgi:hypothetical protein